MTQKPASRIYTIPAGCSFVETLAQGLMDQAGNDPLSLARIQILLPTRRACRSLREAFLKITEGKPLLLPRMHPIGDVDEEELSLTLPITEEELSLPPSIHPMQRLFLMVRLIQSLEDRSRGMEQDLALASALGRLMDQIYTEDLSLADLPSAVDRDDFSEHWQVSINFLEILSVHWPNILAERGVIDAADRRNRLIKKLNDLWIKHPPAHPVVAAGSTGSIPATAQLLKTISQLSGGCVVLPGLDQFMDVESWHAMDDTHPQKTLKTLLEKLDITRSDVKCWPACSSAQTPDTMSILSSEVMRPSETTQAWQQIKKRLPGLSRDMIPIERYDCDNSQEEALVIALGLRSALEKKETTAALVTPDRRLARRVAMACRRWNIEIDDSGGQALSETRVGAYLRLCMEAARQELRPVALLDFCKHGLCAPTGRDAWRSDIRALDKYILRGLTFGDAFTSYRKKMEELEAKNINTTSFKQTLSFIEDSFLPLLNLVQNDGKAIFSAWIEAHIKTAENFCDASFLWAGQDGEAAALTLSDLHEQAGDLPPLSLGEYLLLIERIMKGVTVRPPYGLHPRLMILGQLEARLGDADVMILGGLNEGTWPMDPGIDPWMSRPMRRRFKLPPLERSIGLSAHDFAQCMGAKKIILTRSRIVDGTPTVPSRWLQRMDTVLQACGLESDCLKDGPLLSYAQRIDHAENYNPVERPKPKPPVSTRPRKLSATRIETWMNDPYGIYARYILNLKPLKLLEQPFDAAARGTLIHNTLQRFVEKYKDVLPPDAGADFIRIVRDELEKLGVEADIRTFWEPRLSKIAAWLIEKEETWRADMKPAMLEADGETTFLGPAGAFTLHARVDRIDISRDGSEAAIIDYKSGGAYSIKGMMEGKYPQLPLEALILDDGGFNKQAVPTTRLAYWVVNGGGEGGAIYEMRDASKILTAKENAREGLQNLITAFDSQDTPYYSLPRLDRAPRFNDYAHLERVLEWAALDDQEDAA